MVVLTLVLFFTATSTMPLFDAVMNVDDITERNRLLHAIRIDIACTQFGHDLDKESLMQFRQIFKDHYLCHEGSDKWDADKFTALKVASHWRYPTECFFVKYCDEYTTVSCSRLAGIVPSELTMLRRAACEVVVDQCNGYKDTLPSHQRRCVNCSVRGALDVDHHPTDFKDILDEFVQKFPNQTITTERLPRSANYTFVSKAAKKKWSAFHKQHARYQLLCRACHDEKNKMVLLATYAQDIKSE